MTEQATRVVPAGWYEDPASSVHVRWWNGLTWTEHVENKPEQAPRALAAVPAVDEDRLASARAMEREFGISTAENAIMTGAATAGTATATTGATATATATAAQAGKRPITSTSTLGAILLSLVPVFAVLVTLGSAYFYLYINPSPLVGLVAVVFMLLTFLWAVSDKRSLDSRGQDGPTPGWSLALPFVGALAYLIARRVKVPGNTHLITFLVLTVLAIGGPLAAVATGGADSALKALNVQSTVYAGLVDTGRVSSVTCPSFIENSSPGSVFICDVTMPDGTGSTVWVSIDNPEGDFSWALNAR